MAKLCFHSDAINYIELILNIVLEPFFFYGDSQRSKTIIVPSLEIDVKRHVIKILINNLNL